MVLFIDSILTEPVEKTSPKIHISSGTSIGCINRKQGEINMKKFLGLCLAALVIYTAYYDLKVGTLPIPSQAAAAETHQQQEQAKIPYVKVKVKAGETVLSVAEHLNPSKPVPINQLIHDFKQLNPDTDPNQIQVGETYRFPTY
jgi:cell division protein YceG involved in septum cleavage